MTDTALPSGARVVNGVEVPPAGTYEIDQSHSMVEFVSRYLMMTKVRGRFTRFSGTVKIADEPLQSSVDVTVQAASVDTGDERRDQHLKSPDFLDVERYPTLEFRSTRLEPNGEHWRLEGDLTVRGVTRPVAFDVEYDGAGKDPWGNTRLAFSATTEVDREAWGLTWNQALETGGVLVGRKVLIELAIQALARQP